MLSTVDPELTEMARKIAGVPLIFLHGSTMVLEKPTNKSLEIAVEETKNAVAEDQVAGGGRGSCGTRQGQEYGKEKDGGTETRTDMPLIVPPPSPPLLPPPIPRRFGV